VTAYPRGFPRRGEIYTVDFSPSRGSEQAGRRPAVVVSNDVGNQYSPVVTVAAITSNVPTKIYRWNVPLSAGQPLPLAGTIYCNQVLTIAKDRLENHRGDLSPTQVAALDQALRVALGL
jgi:mRNA interferase MazF